MHQLDFDWVRKKLGKMPHAKYKILDIGCSDGSFLNQFPRHEFELFGIEPNKTEAMKSTALGIRILDSCDDYSDFDVVVIRGTLHHLPNSQEFLNQLLLSFSVPNLVGDKYFFALANPNSEALVYRKFKKLPALEKQLTFSSLYKVWGAKELKKSLEEKGALVKLSYPYFDTPYRNLVTDLTKFSISVIWNTYKDFAFPRNMFNLSAIFPAKEVV